MADVLDQDGRNHEDLRDKSNEARRGVFHQAHVNFLLFTQELFAPGTHMQVLPRFLNCKGRQYGCISCNCFSAGPAHAIAKPWQSSAPTSFS